MSKKIEKATFAGGCFWCMEPVFANTDGIKKLTVGYTGGKTKNPNYQEVGTGTTGYKEAIQIEFEPDKIPYEVLLKTFFYHIDPTDEGGQFYDRGEQYKTAVYYHNEKQKTAAEKYKKELQKNNKFEKIETEILSYTNFYPAEDYHQEYYKKSPDAYKRYKKASGREEKLKKLWQ